MSVAEQQHRAHLERQRRLGKFALAPVSPSTAAQTQVINALRQEVAELSAKLEALKRQDLSPLAPPNRIKPIISAAAKYYGIPLRDLVSFRRARGLIRPRHVAMYLARTLTKHSLPAIGRIFERDHTTIMHGCRQIERQRRQDPELDAELQELIALLTPDMQVDDSDEENADAEKKAEKIRDARDDSRAGSA